MITPLSEALAERGYTVLTPVQQAVIAPELEGADLLVSAQTGSGKTVGFGLAIAPSLLDDADHFGPAASPLALIVAPTRELASQVMRELSWLFARTGAVVTSCVGGMDFRQERRALERGAHLVVGTPGRLRDHIERASLDLGSLRAVVLDEADEMLDMGFREDLEFILAQAPESRRTLMFSATVSPVIAKLAQKYQRNAQRVNTISKADQHADIAYQAVRVAASDVDHAVFNLLRFHGDLNAIVFANTRAAVSHLSARLTNRGLATVSLSGELSQSERTHALQAMRDGRARVCVATDVAARGIDLPKLDIVIHAELPTSSESLLHRSGRTGRAGRKGISALIVPPRSVKKAEQLLRWARISAEWVPAPSVEDILRKDEERLLSDPVWTEPLSEDDATFAEKLLARHAPDAIAAAYLRLFKAGLAAPEDLLPVDAGAKGADRDFGPSGWISLSVGAQDRAEARWLLPMLCRAGGLDRAAIGAIRVQDAETLVELAQARVAEFMAALRPGNVLEDGITVRLLDSAPDLAALPRPARPAADAPARVRDDRREDWRADRGDRPDRARKGGDVRKGPGGQHRKGAAPKAAWPDRVRPEQAETVAPRAETRPEPKPAGPGKPLGASRPEARDPGMRMPGRPDRDSRYKDRSSGAKSAKAPARAPRAPEARAAAGDAGGFDGKGVRRKTGWDGPKDGATAKRRSFDRPGADVDARPVRKPARLGGDTAAGERPEGGKRPPFVKAGAKPGFKSGPKPGGKPGGFARKGGLSKPRGDEPPRRKKT